MYLGMKMRAIASIDEREWGRWWFFNFNCGLEGRERERERTNVRGLLFTHIAGFRERRGLVRESRERKTLV